MSGNLWLLLCDKGCLVVPRKCIEVECVNAQGATIHTSEGLLMHVVPRAMGHPLNGVPSNGKATAITPAAATLV